MSWSTICKSTTSQNEFLGGSDRTNMYARKVTRKAFLGSRKSRRRHSAGQQKSREALFPAAEKSRQRHSPASLSTKSAEFTNGLINQSVLLDFNLAEIALHPPLALEGEGVTRFWVSVYPKNTNFRGSSKLFGIPTPSASHKGMDSLFTRRLTQLWLKA